MKGKFSPGGPVLADDRDTHAQDTFLRTALNHACAVEGETPQFHQRVAEEIARAQARQAPRLRTQRGFRLTFAASGAVAGVALVLAYAAPRLEAAQRLQRASGAMNDARSAHTVTWRVQPDGTRVKDSELWYQDGRWRTERETGKLVTLWREGKSWTYRRDQDWTFVQQEARPSDYLDRSGFSLTALVHDAAAMGLSISSRCTGETQVNGRKATVILVDLTGSFGEEAKKARARILVDKITDLPLRIEIVDDLISSKSAMEVIEGTFNEPLPPALFAMYTRNKKRLVDAEEVKRRWQQQLAKTRIATASVGERQLSLLTAPRRSDQRAIVVRDVQVSPTGTIFVLYTAGNPPEPAPQWGQWRVTASDEKGTQYLAATARYGYNAASQIQGRTEGYVVDGQQVEEAWLVPLSPARSWKSRKMTLTFHEREPVNEHPHSVSFPVHPRRPMPGAVPEYVWGMATAPHGYDTRFCDSLFAEIEAVTRAEYYRNQAHRPEQALHWYRQALTRIEEREQVSGVPFRGKYQVWLAMYELLKELQRPEEARAALLRARDCVSGNEKDRYAWAQIEPILKREGLQ